MEYDLVNAAKEGNLEKVKELLKRGADIDSKDNKQTIPLIRAAEKGQLEVVKELLKMGADINAQDVYGYTALMTAISYGYLEVARELLNDRGVDVDAQDNDGYTPLILAAMSGYLEIVKELLDKGSDINAKSYWGSTALIVAAQYGHVDVVNELLARGADINVKTNQGYTALSMAKEGLVKSLIKHYIAGDFKFNKQNSIVKAVNEADVPMIEYLLKNYTFTVFQLKDALKIAKDSYMIFKDFAEPHLLANYKRIGRLLTAQIGISAPIISRQVELMGEGLPEIPAEIVGEISSRVDVSDVL